MKGIAFTFDDDLSSHYEVVAPMFKKYGLKCTFFLNANNDLDMWKHHRKDVYVMSDEQILEIYEMGFEIGNHTFNHIHIGPAQLQVIRTDIIRTKNKLLSLGVNVAPVLAYPGYVIPRSFPGSRDKRQEVIDAFLDLGYKLGRAGYFDEGIGYDHNLDNNPQIWKRDDTHYYTPKKTNPFLVKCCGLFCENFTFDLFKNAIDKAPEDSYCVLAGHIFTREDEVEKLEKVCRFCLENDILTLNFSELPS